MRVPSKHCHRIGGHRPARLNGKQSTTFPRRATGEGSVHRPCFRLDYHYGEAQYLVTVVQADGTRQANPEIMRDDDRQEHVVEIQMHAALT